LTNQSLRHSIPKPFAHDLSHMSEVQLRPATDADIPAVLAVTKGAYTPHVEHLQPPSSVMVEGSDKVAEYLARGGVIVAEVDGEIVGAVRYLPQGDHVYLGRLAVLPAWQKRGLARRLVEAVEHWAMLLGIDEVRLGVRTEIQGNRQLYLHLGYVEAGSAPLRSDPTRSYLVMKKQLPSGTD
jgi:GNAT superfamily N-acetyltransferase